MTSDIHLGQPVLTYGTDIHDAGLVVILLHGRGADAGSLLPLAEALDVGGTAYLLPQAALNRWYPNTAFGPLQANEPDLTSALAFIDRLVKEARDRGLSDQQIALGGFSQGACLAAEYVARSAMNYAALFVLSGALIGPRGMSRNYPGTLNGMPVFLGCSDVDPWIPHDLVADTAGVFQDMGAEVDLRIYPGMGHTVNQDEIETVKSILAKANPS
jgi:predicted esterase